MEMESGRLAARAVEEVEGAAVAEGVDAGAVGLAVLEVSLELDSSKTK